MKYCQKCKCNKPDTAYHRDRSTNDGLAYYCKQCRAEAYVPVARCDEWRFAGMTREQLREFWKA